MSSITAIRALVAAYALLALAPGAGVAAKLGTETELSGTGDFGLLAAMSGNTAVVSARQFGGSGAVFVYERHAGGADNWGLVATLVASDASAGDFFGRAVAIDGDTAVVGSTHDDDFGTDSGAAYVFERDVGGPGNWGEVKKLTSSDATAGQKVGRSVAVEGDTVVVGTVRDTNAGTDTGAAYVFERNVGGVDNWGEVKKLTASDAAAGDFFGVRLSVAGDIAAIGATRNDDNGTDSGTLYLFERDAGGVANWGEVKKLTPPSPQTDEIFGRAVSISADTLFVGSDRAGGSGVEGAAFVFERDAGGVDNWGHVKTITPAGIESGDFFGSQIAVTGDRVIVGALGDDGIGAAYVFERDRGGVDNWGQVQKLAPSGGSPGEDYGQAVGLGPETAIVGTGVDRAYAYSTSGLRMFVTASAYPADFGGLAGADAICQAEADAASLLGRWRAFLSVPGLDRFDRVPASHPLQRLDGEHLADDATELSGGLDNPLEIEPSLGSAPAGTHVWTGDDDADGNCLGFTATVGDVGEYGLTSEAGTDWHMAGDDACTGSNRLYCVESRCAGAPEPSCVDAFEKGTVIVKEHKVGKELLKIDLKKGPALTQLDFGNPMDPGGTAFAICIYDDDRLVTELRVDRAGDTCGGVKPCWFPLGAFPPDGIGYRYNDKEISADGIQKLQLKAGSVGKSKISLKGKNNASKGQTSLPTGIASSLLDTTNVTVQLHGGDLDACFSATLPDVRKSTNTFLHAKK